MSEGEQGIGYGLVAAALHTVKYARRRTKVSGKGPVCRRSVAAQYSVHKGNLAVEALTGRKGNLAGIEHRAEMRVRSPT